ncbi:hypothetical protein C8046_09300 [Serinibacter arcticus]|uniref:Uncharacterized protein n=1 Tax=Serinibacter arcticus TaxID=1655435 RepID=A0A2U1ZV35_9MICO|nr:hypothetical protein [Serinibacter arcticus]PWD50813.1 hypothetical protein C8046_09300 [Serinibacter arcticus]
MTSEREASTGAGFDVEVAIRRAWAGASALIVATWVAVLPASGDGRLPAPTLALTAAFLVAAVALTGLSWRARPPAVATWTALLLTLALYAWGRLGASVVGAGHSALLLSYGTLTLAVLLRRRPWPAVALTVVVLGWTESRHPLSTHTLTLLGPALATAASCLLVLPILDRMAERIRRSADERAAAVRSRAEQEALLQAHRESQGILHDEALAALRTIATPGIDRGEARGVAVDAWRDLGGGAAGVGPIAGTTTSTCSPCCAVPPRPVWTSSCTTTPTS